MLAYRHLFHAGNFADVFKHAVIVQLAVLIGRKEKPFLYLDTHAGCGRYDLAHAWAQKNREFENGIARIFERNDCPAPIRPYLDAVHENNPDGKLRFYPGSPLLVCRSLRASDRMALTELNRDDCARLQSHFQSRRRVQIRNMDGYQALKAFLPPKERRGLILIDSSFDRAHEFRRLAEAVIAAHKRFATGVYAVWYPLVEPQAVRDFEQLIVESDLRKVLKLELSVHRGDWQQSLRGSAMLVINPPYGFDTSAAPMLHWLWQALSADAEGRYSIKWLVGE
ncbi:MAG: 23S rRNA (adenine(2030)-N(6))-methyltransferase RlmJ [Betaproteobacteria bacterium]|nr:MAG: 23S rRNA (adenine(2030)-N(6))-methyltransferase RlmJ [Betaproteobacteria bacterium]